MSEYKTKSTIDNSVQMVSSVDSLFNNKGKLVKHMSKKTNEEIQRSDILLKILLKTILKNFVFKKKLGSGIGGNVYQIVHYFSKKVYALKIGGKITDPSYSEIHSNIKKEIPNCKKNKQFILNYKKIDPPSILEIEEALKKIKALGAFTVDPRINAKSLEFSFTQTDILIMDSLSFDLTTYLQTYPIDKIQQNNIVCSLLKGILCIHKMNILHGDIKGENILVGNELSTNPIIKYGDFDFAGYKIKPVAGDSRNFSFKKGDDEYLLADDYYQVALVIVQVYDYSLFTKIRNLNSELHENKKMKSQYLKMNNMFEKDLLASTTIPVIKTQSNIFPVRGLLKKILSVWLNRKVMSLDYYTKQINKLIYYMCE